MLDKSFEELQFKANEIRKDVVKMLYKAGSGHPAGSLSATEIITALYFGIMNYDPKKPDWEDRDRFFLSDGHVCPALYSAMALAGYFPEDKLWTYAKTGSALQGHPERTKLLGIESTSGPLGLGLAQASGYALAARMDLRRFRIFCMVSDGEHDEGNHWEAVSFASKYKLSNLTLFVDKNNIQIEGTTDEIMPLYSLSDKYKAFGWNTVEIDGHDFGSIFAAVNTAREYYSGPTVIIARTIAGKGVSFMEKKPDWHSRAPTKEEYEMAMKELKNVK